MARSIPSPTGGAQGHLLHTEGCCYNDRDSCRRMDERSSGLGGGVQNRHQETLGNLKILFTLFTCMINLGVQKGLGWMYEEICPHKTASLMRACISASSL